MRKIIPILVVTVLYLTIVSASLAAEWTIMVYCAADNNLDLAGVEDLNELDTGLFTGLTVAQIRQRYSEAWLSFQRSSWEGVPRAERIADLQARAERLWRDLGRRITEGAGNILCVTHSGILQWIIKATFAQHSWMPLVPVENCSICQFSLDNDLSSGDPRYYFEWSRLNFRPTAAADAAGHMFLEA